jgi:hypothetical protein
MFQCLNMRNISIAVFELLRWERLAQIPQILCNKGKSKVSNFHQSYVGCDVILFCNAKQDGGCA